MPETLITRNDARTASGHGGGRKEKRQKHLQGMTGAHAAADRSRLNIGG
jgi:hypothetical protein